MDSYSSIIDILFSAIRQLEATPNFRRGDPSLLDVKKQLQQAILELWVAGASSEPVECDARADGKVAA